ncbi:MAG TPA: hypothetical protein VEL68_22185 [Thermodesulfobacteriota bacterium]|nr:hypothetical protein [Thermodesulfobacteriota bacterium]
MIEGGEVFALSPGSWAAGGTSLLAKEGFSGAGGDILKKGSGSRVAGVTCSLEGDNFADGRDADFSRDPDPTTAR